jgi:hypothetical protein
VRQIGTTGKSPKVCPALGEKIFPLPRRVDQTFNFARLPRQGAIAIVTTVRWDAMDAKAATDVIPGSMLRIAPE